MRRSLLVAGLAVALVAVVLVLVGLAGSGPLRGLFHGESGISPSAHGGVARVQLVAIPEGPPGPIFERRPRSEYSHPITRIARFIPSPLPAPLNQHGCQIGGELVVTLGDGMRITYGPCHRPASIDHLWAEVMFALYPRCAPRCGPGGATGP